MAGRHRGAKAELQALVRVATTCEQMQLVEELANAEMRSRANMVHVLIREALQARGLLPCLSVAAKGEGQDG